MLTGDASTDRLLAGPRAPSHRALDYVMASLSAAAALRRASTAAS